MAKEQGIRRELEQLKRDVIALADVQDENKRSNGKKKSLIPKKAQKTLKKSKNKSNADKILFFYLRKNGKMDGPFLKKYSNDFITLNYKVHEVDPRATYDWGKHKVYIYKEVDRRPVSNLNLKEIKRRGDLTDSDEILIKATMKAIQEGVKKSLNKGMLIIIGVIVIGLLIFFFAS